MRNIYNTKYPAIISVFTLSIFYFFTCRSVFAQLSASSLPQDSLITSLNEVIVSENRLQTPFSEQNRNINILTKEQIRNLPAKSVSELLSFIPGVDVRQRGPWGTQADVSIDGGTFEQTMILVNGIKVNDPQTAHHSMNIPIPIAAIERIEVIRGPAARIYGINSLTGAINIVTRTPNTNFYEGSAQVSSSFKDKEDGNGVYNGRSLQLGAGITAGVSTHLLYGSHDAGNGYRYNTAYNNSKLFYQGKIKNNHEGLWNLMGGYTYNRFGANAYYAPPNDKEAKEIVQTALFSLGFTGNGTGSWTFAPRVSYRYNYDDYRYNQYDLSLFRNLHHSHVLNTELNTTYNTGKGLLGLGLELRNEFLISTNMGDRQRNNYGMYAEYKMDFSDRLTANMGAYANYNSHFGWQVYPGFDLGYKMTSQWRFYINTGSGQRIPSFTDLYTSGGGNIGNPDLTAENAWYAEGGLKYNSERSFVSASYFYRKINDFIDWTRGNTEESWRPSNFMQNQVHGINVTANWQLNDSESRHWYLNVAYNYLNPKVTSSRQDNVLSKYAIESLRHQLATQLSFNIKSISFSISERFVERINYRNYFLTDAKMSYKWKDYRLFLDANNIFDITYVEASAIPLPGRWFNLGFNCSI
ncbi:TonB-dependent siderophore receptor [Olivibacter sp. XZL3]|uniref:TonB-dependent receptor plug domain-containing protein n=1 Tax=Olivibacter sp. XZL3 TaxID=1735116 RepID=UPI001F10C747|nr:TonB-dependent receptor [Olivibacter sp. XZL3]